MSSHQRSASLPSRLHSTESNVDEELQSLRACMSSPSATTATMCNGLRRLGDVYSSIEEIICLPSSQAEAGLISLPQQKKKMVEEELDRSLVLIDLCNAMQESLAELKTSIHELQLLLRRGDAVAAVQRKMESFVRLAKKAQKPFKNASSIRAAASQQGCTCSRMVRLLGEAREVALSLLEATLLLLLPKQMIAGNSGASKWSLVSRRIQKRKLVCEEEQLQALERSMGDLECVAELLFRRLIQIRVNLLNILSS